MNHPLDVMAGVMLARGPQRLKFFSRGWGDARMIDPASVLSSPVEPIEISWLTHDRDDTGRTVSRGTFTSPAPHLPARSRVAAVISISPGSGTERVVVLMPAWNEHDPRVRVAIAQRLAVHGITSIILEGPYYGSRRPDLDVGQPIATVADFMVMGGSAVIEARGILARLHESGHSVGVAGYSMGGNTAALVSATTSFPMATAPLAASHSPGPVFLDGILRRGIDWDALGGKDQEPHLREALSAISVTTFDTKPHCAAAVVVRAAHDGYIPESATARLAEHWKGSELRVLPGGHATLVWLHKDELVTAIVDSFDRIDEAQRREALTTRPPGR